MIEIVKTFLIVVGMVTIACVIICFAIEFEEKFKSWRKNGCKFKCLCKHEYDFESVNTFRRDALLKCRKCGKKKRIKNFSHEAVDKLWQEEEMKNKEQTNACYGCFGAANGDCDECDNDRSNKDEEL